MADDSKRSFGEWARDTAGISPTILIDLDEIESDWAAVIKLHAILEVGLNQLIFGRLRDSALANIIPKLSMNDDRRGKLAFVKAYGLLPPSGVLLVKVLSDARNAAVHDVANFDFDLRKYILGLKPQDIGNWKTALWWWSETPATAKTTELMMESPRRALWFACISVLQDAFRGQATAVEMYQDFLAENARKREEPNPKES
jgi:hypothetical protein